MGRGVFAGSPNVQEAGVFASGCFAAEIGGSNGSHIRFSTANISLMLNSMETISQSYPLRQFIENPLLFLPGKA